MGGRLTFSLFDLAGRFHSEDEARKFLEEMRWGEIRSCPHCGSEEKQYDLARKGFHRCGECRRNYTVRTGTIFERSHIGLSKWLFAIYFILTARKWISSIQLSKHIGTNQKTAWFMLHRIRSAMDEGNALLPKLAGTVEIDETYVGGKERNKHSSKKLRSGRGTIGKVAVIGIKEREGNVLADVVEKADAETADERIEATVSKDATVMTDESAIYRNVAQKRRHSRVNHSAKQYVDGMASTNGIESVWAVLKRMFYGVYHRFSLKHLQRYVNECTFRLNEGKCSINLWDRVSSLLFGAFQTRLTYRELIA